MRSVVVYTTDTCPYCTMLKDFLNSQEVPFEERNVSRNPRWVAELVELGSRGVPTTVIGGEEVVVGYQPQRILGLALGN
ncbi:MAG: glutaredoxin family protein [Firmicutes bacterium]|nr:glutaredoxin family protein [Bacillota bacterium]